MVKNSSLVEWFVIQVIGCLTDNNNNVGAKVADQIHRLCTIMVRLFHLVEPLSEVSFFLTSVSNFYSLGAI